MSSPETDPDAGWQPPPLPRRLTDPVPAVLFGSGLWLVALVVVGVLTLTGSRPVDGWLWACVVGVGLGAVGLGVLGLQRRARARGSRGAQNL